MPRTTKKTTAPIEKHTITTVPAAEQPYQVPENWRWVRLGEIYVINPPVEGDDSMDVSFVPMEKVNPGMCSDFTFDILPWKQAKKGHTRFANGDIAFAKISPCFENRKAFIATGLLNGIGGGTTELIILRHPKILQKYTYYSIMADRFINGGVQTYSGIVGQQRISMDYVRNYPFPLPPLAEQQRIVDRIERLFAKLDEAREKAQAVVDGFENRKAAILHKAFTGELTNGSNHLLINNNLQEMYKIREHLISTRVIQRSKIKDLSLNERYHCFPKEWEQVKLGTISFVTKLAGFEYSKYFNMESSGEVPVIRAQNVRKGYLDLKNLLYIDKNTSEALPRSALSKACILITFIGAGIGDVCIFEEQKRYHLAPNVAKVEPYCQGDNLINIKFILYYLTSCYGQQEIFKSIKATAQPSLSMETIRDIILPIPDIHEQDDIVRVLDSLFAKERRARDLAESVIAQIDGMKKAILARAFRGELGTNDPSEAACEV